MLKTNYIFLIVIPFLVQGCVFRTITDYENCVPDDLIFEFKDRFQHCIVDDSKSQQKFSSMNIPEGEYFFSECESTSDYKYTKVTTPFRLTGKYKFSSPKALLAAFVGDSDAIQVDINGTKAWMSTYSLREAYYHKAYVAKSVNAFNKKSRLEHGWHYIFECPNDKYYISDWNIIGK